MVLRRVKEIFREDPFRPSFLGLFVNPFYIARRGLYENISALAPRVGGKILDVGCGRKPYEFLFRGFEYIGLELDTPENRRTKLADRYYDGNNFPFGDGEFDSVVSNEVFEHVFNPDVFLSEIHRVLRPGGTLLMTVPFAWDEHEQPWDFARYSSFGLRFLLERHGFRVVELRKSVNDIRAVIQLLIGYIYKKTVTGHPRLNLLAALLLMAPFNLLGELLAKILPANDDLYLDTIVLARKGTDAVDKPDGGLANGMGSDLLQ